MSRRIRLACAFVLSSSLLLTACGDDDKAPNTGGDDEAGGDDDDGQNDDDDDDGDDDDDNDDDGDNDDDDDAPDGDDDDAIWDGIEQACEDDCEAQFALDCAPPNSNELTCKLQCASTTAYLGDFCLGEYEDLVRCRADGGYACINDYPQPLATCVVQSGAYYECTTDLGCKRHCATSVDSGCVDDFGDCFDACVAYQESLADSCQYRFNSLAHCEGVYGDMCSGDELVTPESCQYTVLDIAECMWDEGRDVCESWCWGAQKMGCGDACETQCRTNAEHATCGAAFVEMIDCAFLYGDAVCQDGELIANDSCDYDTMAWQSCLAG